MYELANILDKAEIHFRKYYEMDPAEPERMWQLARFLTENDINVDEAMELIQKHSWFNLIM